MSRGIKDQKEDAREVYADIIDHPHWQSPTRPHMSLYDRAAQFSPFAALTGYDDMVTEEARTVDRKIELDESETARLSACCHHYPFRLRSSQIRREIHHRKRRDP